MRFGSWDFWLAIVVLAMTTTGKGARGEDQPQRVLKIEDDFNFAWSEQTPLVPVGRTAIGDDILVELENRSEKTVVGMKIAVSPPGEGGCKKARHPMSDVIRLGTYYRPLPQAPPSRLHARERIELQRRLQQRERRVGDQSGAKIELAARGIAKIRLLRRQFDAWLEDRRALRCSEELPSVIYLTEVAFADGTAWCLGAAKCSDRIN
jgi:hypothetical protein